MNVLVVEDDDVTAKLLEQVFVEHNINAVVARNHKQACYTLERAPIDVALLDYWLENGTSELIAEMLRENGVPYVMMTAAMHPEKLAATIQATDWIAKPFELDALINTVLKAFQDKADRSAS